MARNTGAGLRSITWVSPRVSHFALLDGFCAIENRDWTRAIDAMTRAASLRPTDPTPRLELAHALTGSRRFKEALQQGDRVLGENHDGCSLAMAWRQRGYILFDLGAFEEARDAYEASLTLEPTNDLAKQELALIAERMTHRQGAQQPGPLPPPPQGSTRITVCPDTR
jgi:Flp pilus assembly protein TadD